MGYTCNIFANSVRGLEIMTRSSMMNYQGHFAIHINVLKSLKEREREGEGGGEFCKVFFRSKINSTFIRKPKNIVQNNETIKIASRITIH